MQCLKPWLAAVLLAAVPASAEILVSGRVAAEGSGAPIAGAPVRLLPVRGTFEAGADLLAGRLEPTAAVEAVCGDDGRFELLAPEAGLWEIRVDPEGFVPMRAQLRPLIEEISLPTVTLKPSRTLRVVVLDPAGEPVPRALVTALTRSHQLWSAPFMRRQHWYRVLDRARADSDGVATLLRAEDEKVEVRAGAPGFAPAEPTEISGDSLELRLRAGRKVAVVVADANAQPVPGALVLVGDNWWSTGLTDEAGRLSATLSDDGVVRAIAQGGARGHVRVQDDAEAVSLALVEPESIPGRVIDAETRRPLAGVLVWSERATDEMVLSDSYGRFSLKPANRGRRSYIQAAAPSYFRGQIRVSSALELEPVIALRPAAAASGEVVDTAGEPIAGAELVTRSLPSGASSFRPVETHTTSDESGRFRFTGVIPESPLRVEATARGYAPTSEDIEPIEAHETRTGLRLVLDRGASLSGRVIGSGEPIAGARLSTVRRPEGSSLRTIWARSMEKEAQTEETDGEGAFEYRNLPAGAYQLSIAASGFATLQVPGVQVEPGGTDLGTLELEPGVEIAGVVVDRDSDPVEGAEIQATVQGPRVMMFAGRGGGAEPPAVTGTDGSFVVADRRQGERVDLHVSHGDHLAATVTAVLAPTTEPVRIVLERGARITGTVVEPSGAPVASAAVSVMVEESDVNRTSVVGRGFRIPLRGRTDDTGRFEIEQVPSGTVRVTASAQGWRNAELSSQQIPAGGSLEGLRLVLERGSTVTGRVLDSDGQPASDARVWVEEQQNSISFSRPSMTTAGGDGQYALEGVEPGMRLIAARGRNQERTAQEIEVTPGINHLDLRFAGGVEVSGRVIDSAGSSVAGASVAAVSEAEDWRGAEAFSANDGAFSISGVRDGQYLLRVTHESYATTILEEPLQVAGGPLSGVEVVLTRGGAITGSLIGLSESQIPLVTVFARSGPNRWSIGQAVHDGSYRVSNLAAGEWEVRARLPEGAQARGRVTLDPGESEATLDLDFSTGLVLTGQVLRAGEAIGGILVQLRGTEVANRSGTRTDHEGRFRIEGLEPGRHRLEVADFRTGLQHQEEIEIDGDRDIVVEIFTGRLAGRVLDADDLSPLAGAAVALLPAEEDPGRGLGWVDDSSTDADGRFVVAQVAAADYRLKVRKEGYAATERLLTVTPDGDLADLEIRLTPTSGLRLRVLGASGAPVARIDYALVDANGRSITSGSRQADANGLVRLPSAPAGAFDLLLSAPGTAVSRLRVQVPGPAVTVNLKPGCRLEVSVAALVENRLLATMRITGTDGAPFTDLRGGTVQGEWEVYFGTQTVTSLPAGSYSIEVTTPDGKRWQDTVRVAPGTITRLGL